jgi:hypothetical protein
MFNYEKVIVAMASSCSENGQKLSQTLVMQGNAQDLFLYYKEAVAEMNGELLLLSGEDRVPELYKLVTSYPLKTDVPYADFYRWVRSRLSTLPILGTSQ